MAEQQPFEHDATERAERIWIVLSAALVAVFVILVFYAVATHEAHIGHAEPRQAPETILARPEFASPGVERVDDERYRAAILAQAFSFTPSEIEVPAGAELTFRITSRDVLHGFQIRGTPVNLELIPGQITELRYRFKEPGEHVITCNQYCGSAHQNMIATVQVVEPDALVEAEEEAAEEEETDEPSPVAEAPAEAPDWRELGERMYGMHCQACHQADGGGLPGAFPPLRGHAPSLLHPQEGGAHLIDLVLYGLEGEIEVQGTRYQSVMPGLPYLDDAEIAAVINHVLHAWQNEAELPEHFVPVEPEDVADRRDRGLVPRDVLEQRRELELGEER